MSASSKRTSKKKKRTTSVPKPGGGTEIEKKSPPRPMSKLEAVINDSDTADLIELASLDYADAFLVRTNEVKEVAFLVKQPNMIYSVLQAGEKKDKKDSNYLPIFIRFSMKSKAYWESTSEAFKLWDLSHGTIPKSVSEEAQALGIKVVVTGLKPSIGEWNPAVAIRQQGPDCRTYNGIISSFYDLSKLECGVTTKGDLITVRRKT